MKRLLLILLLAGCGEGSSRRNETDRRWRLSASAR